MEKTIKEYITGDTLAQIVADGRLRDDHITQISDRNFKENVDEKYAEKSKSQKGC